MNMFRIWKNILDKGGHERSMFMELSKASDTVPHDLMIPNLGTYGFAQDTLQ